MPARALERLGGVIASPRATFRRLLDGEGSMFDVLPWFVVVAVTAAPIAAGQMLLIGRVDPIDGARALLGLVVTRTGGALAGAAVAAVVLVLTGRLSPHRKHAVGFDRSLDACVYCLVPYLVAASLGGALSELGWELWFLPHRLLRGRAEVLAVRFLVAYGGSLLLYALLLYEVWRGDDAREVAP